MAGKRRTLCWPFGATGRPFRPVVQLPDAYCLISPRARRYARILVQYGLLAFVVLILIMWIGAEFEEREVRNARDTIYLYEAPDVCGLVGAKNLTNATSTADVVLSLTTFPNASIPNATEDTLIAHCGTCGSCSNPNDVEIYDDTKDTLFQDTVHCAKKALIWGRKTASNCMEDAVGFTPECTDCWVENIMCDLRKCIFICLWHSIFSEVEGGGASKKLNRCTNCDEKRCGPSFVNCAGANRRRSGILSDIDRDLDEEVCQSVDKEWWTDENMQAFWKKQQKLEAHQRKEEALASTEAEGTAGTSPESRKLLRQ
jgi:hypothetical protein